MVFFGPADDPRPIPSHDSPWECNECGAPSPSTSSSGCYWCDGQGDIVPAGTARRIWSPPPVQPMVDDEFSLVASDSVQTAVAKAVAELDAEHFPDPELKGRGGCVMCWPKDGSWPCTTRMIADDLRAHIERR
jgi:hypothetical protein